MNSQLDGLMCQKIVVKVINQTANKKIKKTYEKKKKNRKENENISSHFHFLLFILWYQYTCLLILGDAFLQCFREDTLFQVARALPFDLPLQRLRGRVPVRAASDLHLWSETGMSAGRDAFTCYGCTGRGIWMIQTNIDLPGVYQFVCLFTCFSVYLFTYSCICVIIYLSLYLLSLHLSIYLFFYLSFNLFISLWMEVHVDISAVLCFVQTSISIFSIS